MKDIINLRFKSVYEFIKKHYRILVIPYIIVSIIYFIFLEISNNYVDNFFTISFFIIFVGSFSTAVIYIVNSLYFDKNITTNNFILFMKNKTILVLISLLFIIIFTNIGFLLLIIPGIIISARLACVPLLISLDNVKLVNSFNLSYVYSKKYTWSLFICLLLISIIPIQFGLIISLYGYIKSYLIDAFVLSLIYFLEVILVFHFYIDIKDQMIIDLRNDQKI